MTEGQIVKARAAAEQRITEEMSQYISGEFEVADVKKAAYKEVFFDDDNAASDRWYKAKLDFITIDEKTEKEKRSRVTYLVQATNLNRAMKNVDDVMGGTVLDIFRRKARLLSNPRYWEVMRTVWVAVGSTETAPLFRTLMQSSRPCRSWFMTPEV